MDVLRFLILFIACMVSTAVLAIKIYKEIEKNSHKKGGE